MKFSKIILNFEPLLMLLALIFFGLSIVIDDFLNNWNSIWRIFFEDGFKLLGIVSWSGYLTGNCWQKIVSCLTVQSSVDNHNLLDALAETTESTT